MQAGLWVDHREAVIVALSDEGDTTTSIKNSGGGRSGGSHTQGGGPGEDTRDRRFDNQLSKYYEEVITHLRDAEAILILGPGEAKVELKARLEHDGLGPRIVGVETADKMTDRQIAAMVRERFGLLGS
jgi:hypothetical protein